MIIICMLVKLCINLVFLPLSLLKEIFFLKSSRPSLPLKKAFSKTYPSFLTVKEGSTSHLGLLSSGEKEETALLGARNRYAIRLSDHQRSSPNIVRDGTAGRYDTIYLSLMLIYISQRKTKTSNKYIVISSLTLLQIQRNLQQS